MEEKHVKEKKIIMGVMCALICIMGVAYAAFATNLTINGTASIESTWSVVFTSITEITKSDGVTITSVPTATGTTATFNVDLKSPGDAITYEITVENKGTLDAIVEDVVASELGSDAIKFQVLGISKGDKLASKASDTFRIHITYDSAVINQPNITTNTLTISVNYVQDIGQTIPSESTIISTKLPVGTELLFNPVTHSKCGTENLSENCYKWYVLNTSGNKVDLILNRNLGSTVQWNSAGGGRSNGPVTLLNYLANQTQNWSSALIRNDTYDEYYSGTVKLYSVNYIGYKARLATAQELEALKDSGGNFPSWLKTNLSGAGYWLASSAHATNSDSADAFFMGGSISTFNVAAPGAPIYLRPVITVPQLIV